MQCFKSTVNKYEAFNRKTSPTTEVKNKKNGHIAKKICCETKIFLNSKI